MKEEDFYRGFLFILFMTCFLGSILMFKDRFKPTQEQINSLHKVQDPIECEKPCCHIFFNKYCEDCRNYNYTQ